MSTQLLTERLLGKASKREATCSQPISFDPSLITSALIIVAHPDDEILGVGGHLLQWPGAQFVHVTDGAPRDLKDAMTYGFAQRSAYADARRKELENALATAGFGKDSAQALGFVDQEASQKLVSLARLLARLICEIGLRVIVTHPYEGGHPDHDAVAFAVRFACKLAKARTRFAPVIVEMACYHNREGIMATGEFLPHAAGIETSVRLTPSQRQFKQRLLQRFVTQQRVLRQFQLDWERFRPAPEYDFRQPPHAGALYYEQFDWGMTGSRWRALAAAAADELELACA